MAAVACHTDMHACHLPLRAGAQYAFIFEDDAMLQPQLLAALVDAKPFPGVLGRSLAHPFGCFALAVLYH